MHSTAINYFLKVWMSLSKLFYMWLIGGTNWYFMSMVVIFILKAVDASLSTKRNPGLIPHFFLNLQLILWRPVSFTCHFYSLLLSLQWHYNRIQKWPRFFLFLLDVMGNRPHKSVWIILFLSCNRFHSFTKHWIIFDLVFQVCILSFISGWL